MRKLIIAVFTLPLIVAAYGVGSSDQVSAKQKAKKLNPDCAASVNPTVQAPKASRKRGPKTRDNVDVGKAKSPNLLGTLKLIAPKPAPNAARRRGPKEKTKILVGRAQGQTAVNGDCK